MDHMQVSCSQHQFRHRHRRKGRLGATPEHPSGQACGGADGVRSLVEADGLAVLPFGWVEELDADAAPPEIAIRRIGR